MLFLAWEQSWLDLQRWSSKSDFSRSWSGMAAWRWCLGLHPPLWTILSVQKTYCSWGQCLPPTPPARLIQAASSQHWDVYTECALGRRLSHFWIGEGSLPGFSSKASLLLRLDLLWKECGKISSHFICLSLGAVKASWDNHRESLQSLCASSQLPRPGDTELRSFLKNACGLNSTPARSTRSQS